MAFQILFSEVPERPLIPMEGSRGPRHRNRRKGMFGVFLFLFQRTPLQVLYRWLWSGLDVPSQLSNLGPSVAHCLDSQLSGGPGPQPHPASSSSPACKVEAVQPGPAWSWGCHDRAVLLYEYVGKRIVDLQHTEVPDAYRGRGIAKHLAKAALDFVVEEDLKAHVTCWYIQKYIEGVNSVPDEQQRTLSCDLNSC
nr:protein NATD1 [Vicugna pacos]